MTKTWRGAAVAEEFMPRLTNRANRRHYEFGTTIARTRVFS